MMILMKLQRSFLTICLMLQASDTFMIADISNSPDFMGASKIFADDAALAIDAIRQAIVPMTLDSAIAIGISEVFAGVAAGAITRRTADLLGDKKKDTFRTKVSTTGAFFGARGLARGFARAIGLPKPLALLFSSLVGSLVSEGTKIAGRTESEQSDRKFKNPTIFEDSGLRGSEISGDIVKWLVYDSLEDNVQMLLHTNNFALIVLATFAVGSISAVSGTLVKDVGCSVEQKKKYASRIKSETAIKFRSDESSKPIVRTTNVRKTPKLAVSTPEGSENFSALKPIFNKYATSAIEGGVLFASYQIVTKIVTMIIPEDFNVKFVFNQVLENIEREIDPDIV